MSAALGDAGPQLEVLPAEEHRRVPAPEGLDGLLAQHRHRVDVIAPSQAGRVPVEHGGQGDAPALVAVGDEAVGEGGRGVGVERPGQARQAGGEDAVVRVEAEQVGGPRPRGEVVARGRQALVELAADQEDRHVRVRVGPLPDDLEGAVGRAVVLHEDLVGDADGPRHGVERLAHDVPVVVQADDHRHAGRGAGVGGGLRRRDRRWVVDVQTPLQPVEGPGDGQQPPLDAACCGAGELVRADSGAPAPGNILLLARGRGHVGDRDGPRVVERVGGEADQAPDALGEGVRHDEFARRPPHGPELLSVDEAGEELGGVALGQAEPVLAVLRPSGPVAPLGDDDRAVGHGHDRRARVDGVGRGVVEVDEHAGTGERPGESPALDGVDAAAAERVVGHEVGPPPLGPRVGRHPCEGLPRPRRQRPGE